MMLSHLGWSLWAWLVSLSMQPGVRYGGRSYRWHMLRAAILERDGYACRECGAVASYNGTWLEVHHRRRVADGGGYGPRNLISLCRGCHEQEHAPGQFHSV